MARETRYDTSIFAGMGGAEDAYQRLERWKERAYATPAGRAVRRMLDGS